MTGSNVNSESPEETPPMIVAIDGPAGAGKSSVARLLAERLGFRFLDTGAMYRAVAWAGLQQHIDWRDEAKVAAMAKKLRITLTDRVHVNDLDITTAIRSPQVTEHVCHPADNVDVRKVLVQWQREFAREQDTVTEGRDQGTVAFPDAECKIFLTATPQERARRRYTELTESGTVTTYEEILRKQEIRDRHDEQREVGGLRKAPDAIEFFTDGLSTDRVVEQLETLVRRKMQLRPQKTTA